MNSKLIILTPKVRAERIKLEGQRNKFRVLQTTAEKKGSGLTPRVTTKPAVAPGYLKVAA
jgi:hypothetical protein